jgi:outer membrane protein assembly factor BamA
VAAEPTPEPPPWTGGSRPAPYPARRDTAERLAVRTPLVERGGPFALPDSVLGQSPTPYRVRLAPDFAGGGFYAASSFGFIGSTQFLFSDFLGNHSDYVATDVFSSSLSETNALAVYNYLPRRWDFGGGLFHFKNYYSSRVTTLGDALGSPRLFSERNFGVIANVSYPFDRFRRMDLSLTQLFAEIRFFDPVFGTPLDEKRYQSVTSPSVSLVMDNALFGNYGPVNGRRYNLTYSPSFAVFDNGLNYHTVTADLRKYWDLTHGYTFAVRGLGGYSGGADKRTFFVGGFSTLRGFEDYSLEGNRVAIGSVELRFPFIQQLGLVGPVPIGVFNLRGAVFADVGAVWNQGDKLQLSVVSEDRFDSAGNPLPVTEPFKGLGFGFGGGIRTAVYFFILKLDAGWNTDFKNTSKPRWHFSIGPEF